MKPHKHAALIHAWADGAEIEARVTRNDQWVLVDMPVWIEDYEYRVKPKPDVVRYMHITAHSYGALSIERYTIDSLRVIFDGETGKLKKAEVL